MSIDVFSKIVVSARNSGIEACRKICEGEWKPKNPDQIERDMTSLIASLSVEDKEKLLNVLRYSVDLSFFKLLDSLEMGKGDVTFSLQCSVDGKLTNLINDNEDLGLRSEFFKWINALGQ